MGQIGQSAFSTAVGNGMQNLSSVLFGDPSQAGRLAYMRARASLEQQQMEDLANQADARAQGAALIGQLNPNNITSLAPRILSADYAAGGQARNISDLFLANVANTGGNDATRLNAYVGSGHAVNPNDTFSLEGQQALRAATRSQAVDDLNATIAGAMQRTLVEQGHADARNSQDNDTRLKITGLEQEGNDRRNTADNTEKQWEFTHGPINAGAGDTVYGAPGDPRFPNGTLKGAPTEGTVAGAIYSGALANGGQVSPAGQATLDAMAATKLKGSASDQTKPTSLSPNDGGALEKEITVQLGIGQDAQGKPTGPSIDPGALSAVRVRAADIYNSQPTGQKNLPAAVDQAIKQTVTVNPAQPGSWIPWKSATTPSVTLKNTGPGQQPAQPSQAAQPLPEGALKAAPAGMADGTPVYKGNVQVGVVRGGFVYPVTVQPGGA